MSRCKHQHAWKLYQYVERKMQALPPVTAAAAAPTAAEPLYEALASVNVRVLIAGHG